MLLPSSGTGALYGAGLPGANPRLRRRAQQQIRLSVFRMDELSELRLVPSPAPRDTLSIVADPAAGEREKALRAQWLGGAFPGDDKASA